VVNEFRGYTEQEQAAMAARLDAAIELSALCMDLALAGARQRDARAQQADLLSAEGPLD